MNRKICYHQNMYPGLFRNKLVIMHFPYVHVCAILSDVMVG